MNPCWHAAHLDVMAGRQSGKPEEKLICRIAPKVSDQGTRKSFRSRIIIAFSREVGCRFAAENGVQTQEKPIQGGYDALQAQNSAPSSAPVASKVAPPASRHSPDPCCTQCSGAAVACALVLPVTEAGRRNRPGTIALRYQPLHDVDFPAVMRA